MRWRSRWAVLAAALVAGVAGAQTAAPPGGEDDESKLLAILAEETAVATKTRLNSDFVPGIVTVLHGEELEALGIETAWEALSLVPGVQAFRDGFGQPSVIVRGEPFPFNSGNVKVLVNGISMSREIAGINGIALDIPVQEIDRIEVIRGPGSVIYGDFAFMGLVNIVTKKNETSVYARHGGYDAWSGGATAGGGTGDWSGTFTGSGLKSASSVVPEPRSGREKRGFFAGTLQGQGLTLSAEGIERRVDDTSALPGASAASSQSHFVLEARYARDLAPSLRAEARAGFQDDDFSAGDNARGSVVGTGLDLTYGGVARNSFLLSLSYETSVMTSATYLRPPPPPPAQPPPPVSFADKRRDIFGITLQDQLDVSDKLAVTAGARFDRYTDVDHRVTPRLAFVYRASDEHLLKLQYAEGFRAPTLFELYGGTTGARNPDIGFEINRTTELDYVFRRPREVARATLFYTKLDDMIFLANPARGTFGNVRSGRSYGVELEWERELFAALKAVANLSWVDARDDRSLPAFDHAPTPAAKWIWNAALVYRPARGVVVGARWNHVGNRSAPNVRDATDLVDLTVTKHQLLFTGLSASGGVKDVFGSAPTYAIERPFGTDYHRFAGRTWFVQLAYAR
jgi:outer membrane receptor for ferrienterochelin and colicins